MECKNISKVTWDKGEKKWLAVYLRHSKDGKDTVLARARRHFLSKPNAMNWLAQQEIKVVDTLLSRQK